MTSNNINIFAIAMEKRSQPLPDPGILLHIGGMKNNEVRSRSAIEHLLQKFDISLNGVTELHVVPLMTEERSQVKAAKLNRNGTDFEAAIGGRRESAIQGNFRDTKYLYPKIDPNGILYPKDIAAIRAVEGDRERVLWTCRSVHSEPVDRSTLIERQKEKNQRSANRLSSRSQTGLSHSDIALGVYQGMFLVYRNDRLIVRNEGGADLYWIPIARVPVHTHLWYATDRKYEAIATWINIQHGYVKRSKSMPGEDPKIARELDRAFSYPYGTNAETHDIIITPEKVSLQRKSDKALLDLAVQRQIRNGVRIAVDRDRRAFLAGSSIPCRGKFDDKFWDACDRAIARHSKTIDCTSGRDRNSDRNLTKTVRKAISAIEGYQYLAIGDLQRIASHTLAYLQVRYSKSDIIGLCKSQSPTIKAIADTIAK